MTRVTVDHAMRIAAEHYQAGRFAEAEGTCRQILASIPDHAGATHLLGVLAGVAGYRDAAVELLSRAVKLAPQSAEAHSDLGNALWGKGRIDEAIAVCRRAIELKPNDASAYCNLGNALQGGGRLDEAIAAFRKAVQLDPNLAAAQSNLIYTLHFHADYDQSMILKESLRWAEMYEKSAPRVRRPHVNDRSPHRRLRVGYVSADLREHVVGWTLEPLLAHRDKAAFEIFCYANHPQEDAVTSRLKQHADRWRRITGLSDDQAAQIICDDRIDILVDLGSHTAGNRLGVFARKPAPVQVTHISYPSTTGLSTMDYRITDAWLDPPGMDQNAGAEKLVRLNRCWYCYVRGTEMEVKPPPALAAGFITFGSLNQIAKVTPQTIQLWCTILNRVPSSRMLMLDAGGPLGNRRLLDLFARHGVSEGRVTLLPRCEVREYLGYYHRIDIALDTFPYHGGVTTCDALWMGVPVITLGGQTGVCRAGLSILDSVGECFAVIREEYVEFAVGLTEDLERLSELRSGMRQRMLESPLTDGIGFAREVERAYRQMWTETIA